jgi:hypothetical protein
MNGGNNMTNNQEYLTDAQKEAVVKGIENKLATNREEGLKLLRSYDHNDSEDLKWDILVMVRQFGLNTDDKIMRQELVIYMLDVYTNETLFLQGQAVRFLQDFSPSDFNVTAIEKLKSLSWSGEYGNEVIRLIGLVDLRSKTPELEELTRVRWQEMNPSSFYASSQWAASLVCSRFGDIEITKRVIERVKTEPDIILRATILFQDLAFTQQQLAFDALRDFLHSKERLPELKESDPGRLEALEAAYVFVKYVEGCPDPDSNAKESQLDSIIKWADAQTEWKIRANPKP